MLAVSKDLLSAKVLLLHGPLALLILLLLFHHVSLSQLHVPLIHHLVGLLSIEALKVVWDDTVSGEHALSGGWVLSHEVVVVGEVDISGSLQLLVVALCVVSVALLLGKLHVGILDRLLHSDALGGVLVLCILEHVVEVLGLGVVGSLSEFGLILEHLFLTDLLVDPVLLL